MEKIFHGIRFRVSDVGLERLALQDSRSKLQVKIQVTFHCSEIGFFVINVRVQRVLKG